MDQEDNVEPVLFIALPKGIMEQIAGYLASRPFREVVGVMSAIEQHGIALRENDDKYEKVGEI